MQKITCTILTTPGAEVGVCERKKARETQFMSERNAVCVCERKMMFMCERRKMQFVREENTGRVGVMHDIDHR